MITATLGLTVSKHRNSKGHNSKAKDLHKAAAHSVTQTQWTSLVMICRSEVQHENDFKHRA